MTALFGLVDCNNFYVSCERLFKPVLEGRPVVVLSNNDGCIIARSNEAKALGIAMGAALFEARPLIAKHQIEVYSSNYVLYGDMSGRVMAALARFTPNIEVYSIDEAFLDLSGFADMDMVAYGRQIRAEVGRWTGIPVSIGIAPTKTLAKLANRIAKKNPGAGGVCDLRGEEVRHAALAQTAAGDVWGIGRRWAAMLKRGGVETALDLCDAPGGWVRQRMGVVGARTRMELKGAACLEVESQPAERQSTVVSRSFKRPLEGRDELQGAVAAFAERAAEKIRLEGLSCAAVTVFVDTGRFASRGRRYRNDATVPLAAPSSHTGDIAKAALRGLAGIFRPGPGYKQAGVLLCGLAAGEGQADLFAAGGGDRDKRLMEAFDRINRKFGRQAVRFATAGAGWRTVQTRRSPHYTTNWDELPLVGG